jgi:hypothetical protein
MPNKNRKRRNRRKGGGRGLGSIFGRMNLVGPFNSMQIVPTRLCQSVTFSSNGAGTLAALIYLDPFSQSFTEYTSDFVNLYTQFRLIRSRIQLVSTIETKGDVSVLGVGYQNRQTGLGTPTSINAVLDNQPSWLWAVSNDTTNQGFIKAQRMNNLLFADTSSSANTSTSSSGAPGGWQLYGAGFPASTVIMYGKIEVWYEFRSRS